MVAYKKAVIWEWLLCSLAAPLLSSCPSETKQCSKAYVVDALNGDDDNNAARLLLTFLYTIPIYFRE